VTSRDDSPSLPPARKRLGQHFLTDRTALDRIVAALDPSSETTVVEVGPGRGALTDLLVPRSRRLVAVEIDRMLVPILRERYASSPHVTIVEGDVLDIPLGTLVDGPYVLVGNVPYYITTPIIFHALRPPRPLRAVYLLQREVAERIAAPPGDRTYGALSVNVQALAHVELVGRVPAGAFHPRPSVDSAIVRLTPRREPAVLPMEEEPFRALVQGSFGFRRKQMRRVVRSVASIDALGADRALAESGIDPEARPETLAPERFAALLRALARIVDERSGA
jgi:16S rRNA (adenine1518-N6/adenine1519-N6)-dimethyltransferase